MEEKVTAVWKKLQEKLASSERSFDLERIEEAFRLAESAHGTQLRDSGEPYITHPLEVACIVVELGMDTESVVAALLHDVVEDTEIGLALIEKKFGKDVAALVNGLTKLRRIPYSSREEQQAESLRKMILAMSKDIRVVVIKLADRLHNMRTIDYRI